MTPKNAKFEIEIDESLLAVEYDVPRVEENLDENAEVERERYDEQILAALVTF